MSEHAWTRENIAAFVAGGLDAAEAERLEGHVNECLECAAALQNARTLDQGLDALFVASRPGPALEDRIKVCVLIVPGFNLQRSLPEVDELNFAPRVKVPVLMLNGRFDFFYPVETSREPMFRLLGTPKQHKRRVVYETGHNIPRNELIKETLDWLDRYLGPVK